MAEAQNDNENRPSLADAINAVMADPSIIQGAIDALKKSGVAPPQAPEPEPPTAEIKEEKDSDTTPASAPQNTGELINTLAPMLSMLSSHPASNNSTKGGDRRAALLVALRPYLSESRREAIDYIVKISQVSELIKNSGR